MIARRTICARGTADDFSNSGNSAWVAALVMISTCPNPGEREMLPPGCALCQIGCSAFEKPTVVQGGQWSQCRVPMGAVSFFFGQLDETFQVAHIPVLQQRVQPHRAEGGRQRQSQARFDAVPLPPLQHLQQRDVTFCDRLEQPVFLQKPVMFRMANKGQVRVQDERKVTGHRGEQAKERST